MCDGVVVARAPRVGMIFCLLGVLVFAVAMIKPDALREAPMTPNEIFWFRLGCPFLIFVCIYGLLFFWKARLILTPSEILIKTPFSTRQILHTEIRGLLWGYEKALNKNGIYFRIEGSDKLRLLDTFTLSADDRRIIRYLRETIPLDKQVGWKEYYLRNRRRMIRPQDRERFSDPRQRKALLYAILAGIGLIGFFFLAAFIATVIAGMPWLFSGFLVLLFLGVAAFILWPRKRDKDKSSDLKPCPTVIKVGTFLFFLYLVLLGLALTWDWSPGKLFASLVAWGMLIGLCGGGGLLFVYLHKETKERNAKDQLAREAEDAKYEKYAELLLPPELEE